MSLQSRISLIPWDANSPAHRQSLTKQRVECSWDHEKVEEVWRKQQLKGEKCIYWIVSSNQRPYSWTQLLWFRRIAKISVLTIWYVGHLLPRFRAIWENKRLPRCGKGIGMDYWRPTYTTDTDIRAMEILMIQPHPSTVFYVMHHSEALSLLAMFP